MTRLGAVLICLALVWSGAAHADPRADDLLARSKAAMGGSAWDGVHFIRTRAQVQTSGLSGPGETVEDALTGAYVNSYVLGGFKAADGYDGATVWSQDPSGQVAVQGGADARQGAVDNAYRAMRAYWFRSRMSAEVLSAGAQADGGRSFDVVRITPKAGRPFDLWIDATTHVIDRVVERTAQESQTTLYSDYRLVEGRLTPFAWRQTNGDARYDTVVKIDSVSFEDRADARGFAPPPPPKRDFGFAGSQSSVTVPFRLINNHIYIEVKLNGRGPYQMLLDTGGSATIMPKVAKDLGLKLQGAFQGGGTGEKTVDVAVTSVDRVEIGGAWLEHQTFQSSALDFFDAVEGEPFDGIVGYEVFKRFVVRTDYEKHQVTLIEPEGFKYEGAGQRTPFELKETIPIVPGDIDGIAGTFQLDTGSRMSLDLMSPFVLSNDLVSHYRPKIEGVNGWGIGGPDRSWFVRARRFTFGGVTVEAPVLGLSQLKKGSTSEAYTSGNVGGGIFRKFNIVWDYPHNQLFFERNTHFADPDVFNRAGLWANLGGGGFEVIDVYAGSPAAEAGLTAGDRILTVDGRQAQSDITLPQFRERMRGAPGSRLRLGVERGGRRLTIVLTLRDLV